MTNVGGCLAGLLAGNNCGRIYEAEGVDNDLALDGLYGVNDDGDGAGIQSFKGLDLG